MSARREAFTIATPSQSRSTGTGTLAGARLNRSRAEMLKRTDRRRDLAARPAQLSLTLLLALFAGSGFSALVYEIVWFQLLQVTIGSSAVSMAVVLATFMGGMCIGSLAAPRVAGRWPPLRVYAALEAAIGVAGIALLLVLPAVAQLYAASIGHGVPGLLLRGVASALCLLLPTVLMGATLPIVARRLDVVPQGLSWIGFLYAANTVGAVIGCLAAGLYLLRVRDIAAATYVAAAINLAIAGVAFALGDSRVPAGVDEEPVARRGAGAVYVVIALSGFCALAAEVIWTRLLSLLLGPTVYVFSIILAVFLASIAVGSAGGAAAVRWNVRPRVALGVCQMMLTGAIAWGALIVAKSLPYWPINPALSTSTWVNLQIDLLRCAWAVTPAALLWGASFPLAVAVVAGTNQHGSRAVGRVYAANTVGAIAGALAASLLLIPRFGTQRAQQFLVWTSLAAAALLLLPAAIAWRSTDAGGWARRRVRIGAVAGLAASTAIAVWLALSVPAIPPLVFAYGRFMATWIGHADVIHAGEGMDSSIAVSQWPDGVRNFHVSGKLEASTQAGDMRLQRMLAHLPAQLHGRPRSVLVVGCGAGVTAGSFVPYPEVERIVIAEIERLIPPVAAAYFRSENNDVVNDRRVEIAYDDARHYLLTTTETFDVITSDPIHPWVKGSAMLYTTEYFDLVKRHLKPGGVVTQWVPLYESNEAVVKSEMATFFTAFPNGTIWANARSGPTIDVVLLGQAEPARIDVDAMQQRFTRPERQRIAASLQEVGFQSPLDMLATFAGASSDLRPWLGDAAINHDRDLRLQYLAGLGLNGNESRPIYDAIVAHRRFSDDVFAVTDQSRSALLEAAARQ